MQERECSLFSYSLSFSGHFFYALMAYRPHLVCGKILLPIVAEMDLGFIWAFSHTFASHSSSSVVIWLTVLSNRIYKPIWFLHFQKISRGYHLASNNSLTLFRHAGFLFFCAFLYDVLRSWSTPLLAKGWKPSFFWIPENSPEGQNERILHNERILFPWTFLDNAKSCSTRIWGSVSATLKEI